MVVNSSKEKTLVKYSNYKDSIRFLLHFFGSEKKSTVELDKCVKHMSESSKTGLTECQCRDLINEMSSDDKEVNMFTSTDFSKKWLNQIKVRHIPYLQMNKDFQLNDLHAICDKAIEKLKSS
jgi:hypothetical protein